MSGQEESPSTFGDWACGEPLTAQHLLIDFTPCDEIDTDFVQKKCCAFWDLVSKSHQLKDLVVLPEIIKYNRSEKMSSVNSDSDSSTSSASSELISCERTALSVLEFAEEKGVVNTTFEPRLPVTCSFGPGEYLENEPTADTYSALLLKNKAASKTAGSFKSKQPKGAPSTPEVKHLCNTMRVWDSDHPKSMEPPGRVPYLSHCLMQRNVIS